MRKRKTEIINTIIIVVIILLIIIIFLISIGKIDLFEKSFKTPAKIQEKDTNETKRKELKIQIEEKQKIKKYLDSKANRLYIWAKFVIALFYLGANIIGWMLLWSGDFNQTLGFLITYNEAVFILYVLIMLVIPKKPLSISSLVQAIRLKIRRLLYFRNLGLEDEIKELGKEIDKLNSHKAQIDKQQL